MGNSRKSLNIGNKVLNRDSKERLKQFKEDNPEIKMAYSSASHLQAPGKHPEWKLLNMSLTNSSFSLKDNVAKYLRWVENNTDYDIIEVGNNYERAYRPNGDPDRDEMIDQGITIRMRNEEDIS